jgi:hypothetical protein
MAIFRATPPEAAPPLGITLVDGSHPEVLAAVREVAGGRATGSSSARGKPRSDPASKDKGRNGGRGKTKGSTEPTRRKGHAADRGSRSSDTANEGNAKPGLPSWYAGTLTGGLFAAALAISAWWFGHDGGPSYTAARGIGAFALFYVVAQAAERLVEVTMPWSEKVVAKRKDPKSALALARDAAVVDAVNATGADAQTKAEEAADAQAAVDQARADRTLISFGATAALGMLLCSYLGADFLTSVGVDFTPGDKTEPDAVARVVMMAVTGLVIGAGSKQLHDTISNISKSSDQKSTPTETGGKK